MLPMTRGPGPMSSPLLGRQVPTHLQGLAQLMKGPFLAAQQNPHRAGSEPAEGHARGSRGGGNPDHAVTLASPPPCPVSQGQGSRAVFTVIVT